MATTVSPTSGPVERFFSVDDHGVGLRASWRPAHGFVNLSLWDGDTCRQAFHLTPAEAGRLSAFLATNLMAAVPEPPPAPLELVADPPPRPGPTTGLRGHLARVLDGVRRRLGR